MMEKVGNETDSDGVQAALPDEIEVDGGRRLRIPRVGGRALQMRFCGILAEADPRERREIIWAWHSARRFGDEQRFRKAVMEGKDALLEVGLEIQEQGDGRIELQDLLWEIRDTPNPGRVVRSVLAVSRVLQGPEADRIRPLFLLVEREWTADVLRDHPGTIEWLLMEGPGPDDIPTDATVRGIGDQACGRMACAIQLMWSHAREIALVLDAATPDAARTALLALAELSAVSIHYNHGGCKDVVFLRGEFMKALRLPDQAQRDESLDAIIAGLRGALPDLAANEGAAALKAAERAMEAIILLKGTPVFRVRPLAKILKQRTDAGGSAGHS